MSLVTSTKTISHCCCIIEPWYNVREVRGLVNEVCMGRKGLGGWLDSLMFM